MEIRPITPDEVEPFRAVMGTVFGSDPNPADLEVFAASAELDRTRAVVDGGRIVASSGADTMRVLVPGGREVATAGVTMVGVLPTHRRRGLLNRMMRSLLEDGKERGEPLAALWASEASIYGRYGYGIASHGRDLEFSRAAMRFREPPPVDGLRLIDAAEAEKLIPPAYDLATADIPGSLRRSDGVWGWQFYDPEHRRRGSGAKRYVVYERDGVVRGYAEFRQKGKWEDGLPAHELSVEECQAADAEAYRAVWGFLFGIDLVTKMNVSLRRTHEPILDVLVDPRQVKGSLGDHLWVALLDVPAALEARGYAHDGSMVLEVVDQYGYAAGTYRIEVEDGAAAVATGGGEPDLTVTAAQLGAAYLGRPGFTRGAFLGGVHGELSVAHRADTLFHWPTEPWCTVIF